MKLRISFGKSDKKNGRKKETDTTSNSVDGVDSIVFLHGLTGKRASTWTAKRALEPWPATLLPEEFPNLRVLAFGYDADVVRMPGPVGQNTIRQHARNLIESLSNKRADRSRRPIIFAAHSLGGLVTEEAIRLANESPDDYLNVISMSVSAIIFFGTPHSGSGWSTLADGLASLVNLSLIKQSNRSLIDILKRDSEQLASLQGSFSDLNRRRNQGKSPGCSEIQIHCFHEELPVKGLGHVIVTSQSARYPGHCTEAAIHADHMEMTRFDSTEDAGFDLVRGTLSRYLESLPVEGRKESLNLDTSYRHQDDISCHQSFKTSRYEEFKDRNPERVHGTCEWVLNHERYQSWCRSPHSDLLWISADPGCGKSVLSKFLIDQELRTEGLRSTCYFFFKDNEEQNDVAIALCAVLHQLFTHKPELLRHATPIWQRNKEKLQQETGELWRILLSAATDPAAGHVVCVLDALDECENQGRERLIGHLKRFHNSSTSAKKFSLKFLVTSRPYVNIKDQWHGITSGIPTIWLAGETMNEDISKEINHVIDAQILEISDKKGLSQDLQESLKMKLKGTNNRTYLWLYLVLEQIRDSLKHTPKTYDRILDTIPSSVEEAYEKILSKSTNKQETQSLLHIMVGAARPLTLREMDVAFSLATQNGCKSYADLDRDGANLETRIRNLCGLFVYVTNSRVQLIHQTAKEFLMQKKSSSLRSLEIRSQSLHEEKPAKELLFERKVYSNAGSQTWSSSIQEENAEKMMASICMQYLLFIDFGGPVEDKEIGDEETEDPVGDEETESVESPEFEFMDYAAVNWTVHFRNAQISEGNLLLLSASALYETSSCRLRIWFSRYWEKLHPYRPQPQVLINLHFAAITGSTAIVQKLLMARHAVNVDTKDGTNQTALHWAVRNGHEAVVRLLLKKGAGIDVRDKKGRTALHWAAGSGHEAVVRLLLEKGAGVDFQDEDGETALYWAAESGHEAVVWLLLEKGAGVDVQGEDGETALYWAAESGREAVVRLLLEKGAGVDVWDRYGETALYLAAENGHEAVLRLLLEKGAGVDVQDGNGRTALYWAARRGHEAVVRLLESYNPAH